MCAILQLVSAPLNPIPIVEHFRRSHLQCEHIHGQHIYVRKIMQSKIEALCKIMTLIESFLWTSSLLVLLKGTRGIDLNIVAQRWKEDRT